MTAIATYVVVVVFPLSVVYLVFRALVRGVPKDRAYEIEVRLFPPRIRQKVERDRRSLSPDTVPNGLEMQPRIGKKGSYTAPDATRTDTRASLMHRDGQTNKK
jgi:hypothetical protein